MMKRGILLNFKGSKLIEVKISKFGNGAHALIPKEYSNKKIKVIIGEIKKIRKDSIQLDFFKNEILEKIPSKFGTSFHITLPKSQINKKIKLIVGGKNE